MAEVTQIYQWTGKQDKESVQRKPEGGYIPDSISDCLQILWCELVVNMSTLNLWPRLEMANFVYMLLVVFYLYFVRNIQNALKSTLTEFGRYSHFRVLY